MRVIFCFLIAILISHSALANRDSIGLKTVDNKKFIMHKVERGEGFFAISRRYNVDVDIIKGNNPEAVKNLLVGSIVLVPYDNNTVETKPVFKTPPQKEPIKETVKEPVKEEMVEVKEPIYHTVSAGETLYRVSLNNKISVDELKSLNKLTSNNIEVGQKLIVGYKISKIKKQTTTTKVTTKENLKTTGPEGTIITSTDGTGDYIAPEYQKQYDDYKKKFENIDKKKAEWKEIRESVKGSWIDDGSIVSEKNLALHVSAPPGTIVKITNPMNGKSVYVKIIASFPAEEDNVNIKITRTTADKLGIKDNNFRLDLHYGIEILK